MRLLEARTRGGAEMASCRGIGALALSVALSVSVPAFAGDEPPEHQVAAPTKELTIVSWGGAYTRSQMLAYVKPYRLLERRMGVDGDLQRRARGDTRAGRDRERDLGRGGFHTLGPDPGLPRGPARGDRPRHAAARRRRHACGGRLHPRRVHPLRRRPDRVVDGGGLRYGSGGRERSLHPRRLLRRRRVPRQARAQARPARNPRMGPDRRRRGA